MQTTIQMISHQTMTNMTNMELGGVVREGHIKDNTLDNTLDKQDMIFERSDQLQQLLRLYNKAAVCIVDPQQHAAPVSKKKQQQDPCACAHLAPAAFVWGLSGTGKSHLLGQFFAQLRRKTHKQNTTTASMGEVSPQGTSSTTTTTGTATTTVNESKLNNTNNYNHSRHGVHILQGKVDEYNGANDPYMAIDQALSGLVQELLDGPPGELSAIQNSVQAAISSSDDAGVLIRIVPSLAVLFRCSIAAATSSRSSSAAAAVASFRPDQTGNNDHGNIADAWNRVQYLFTQLIKALASSHHNVSSRTDGKPSPHPDSSPHPRPIILFLDDLQWASPVTINLLHHLLSDPTIHNFMFVGAIRQESNPHDGGILELAKDHPLTQMLHKLSTHESNRHFTHIELSNLTHNELRSWLACRLHDIQGDSSDRTPAASGIQALIDKIYLKTRGNPYFVTQTIEDLKRTNALTYNPASSSWEWTTSPSKRDDGQDQHSESGSLSLANDVVDIVTSKLRSLPKKLRQILTVAAYIRSQFELTALHTVWMQVEDAISEYMDDDGDDDDGSDGSDQTIGGKMATCTIDEGDRELVSFLEQAVLEGLLCNAIGADQYRFAHDRVQQAAHGLVDQGECRNKLRACIGECLLKLHRNNANLQHRSADDGLLFIAADHFNAVPTKDHMFLASLNLEAGELSLQKSALTAASAYLEKSHHAFKKIGNHLQRSDAFYNMQLRLNYARANTELALGNYQLGEQVCNEVLRNATNFEDKMQTYYILVVSLGRQDRHEDAFRMARHVTQTMGVFPKRWHAIHAAKDWLQISSFFKNNSDEDILSLPVKTDPNKRLATKFLVELGIRAFFTKNMMPWFVALCKQIKITMTDGLCPSIAMAMIYYAIVKDNMKDHASAVRVVLLARQVLDVTNGKYLEGWVYLLSSAWVLAWTRPNAEVLSGFQRGRDSAMESGDLEIAFINWQSAVLYTFMYGEKLQSVLIAARSILEQAELYQIVLIQRFAKQNNMLLENLAGETPIDWEDIRTFGVDVTDPGETYHTMAGYMLRLPIAVYFFKYEWAVQMAKRYAEVASEDANYQQVVTRLFFTALAFAGRYRQTKLNKHLKGFSKTARTLKTMMQNRGMNGVHRALILDAEKLSLKGARTRSIVDAYHMAIAVAIKSGHIQDAALASELAGETFLRLGKHELIGDYFTRAAELYHQWGCMPKVDHLKERRLIYLDAQRMSRLTVVEDQDVVSMAELRGGSSHRASDAGSASFDLRSSGTPAFSKFTKITADTSSGFLPHVDEEGDDDDVSVLTDKS